MPQTHSLLDPRLHQLASHWFLQSGIQEANGGVARYYLSDARRNARVSTEITGYAISTLVFLYQRYRNAEVLEAAVRAGRFLIETAWSPSLRTFPFEYAGNGDAPQPLTYFFDCGIIVRGLLALWRVTEDSTYREIAIATGESMAKDFDAGGRWHPILDLPGKYPLQWTNQWSRRPGCYQLKSAMAWHDLFKVTGESKFEDLYAKSLAEALATEGDFLPAESREKTMDRLHAYCYFLEGLMPAAERSDVRQTLSRGIVKVSEHLRDIRSEFERSDVYGQLLRIRLLAANSIGLPLAEEEAAEEASALTHFQIDQPGCQHHGGFLFGRKAGEPLPFINPVSTAFCLQAYEWWQDHLAGRAITQALI